MCSRGIRSGNTQVEIFHFQPQCIPTLNSPTSSWETEHHFSSDSLKIRSNFASHWLADQSAPTIQINYFQVGGGKFSHIIKTTEWLCHR